MVVVVVVVVASYCLCQRLSPDGKYVACEMGAGDHFCTFGILFDINSEASVVAKTYCEVLRLMKEDLDTVLADHRVLIKSVPPSSSSSSSSAPPYPLQDF